MFRPSLENRASTCRRRGRLLRIAATMTLLGVQLPAFACWNNPTLADGKFDDQIVGEVLDYCCKPGRRWGCDPQNFNQSGCVPIIGAPTNCRPEKWRTMRCTSSQCEKASSEDVCEFNIRLVGRNQCRPTGRRTTIGCPDNHWKCQVEMIHYYDPGAVFGLATVCDTATSTICNYNYSPCD